MKKPTPKRKQPRSYSKRRYKSFQNFARKRLMGRVASMKKLKALGRLSAASRGKKKAVTTIKV
ncbi:MAG: hypothetical protein V1908_02820 [Candidatus Peregrinibacteria bacterium]